MSPNSEGQIRGHGRMLPRAHAQSQTRDHESPRMIPEKEKEQEKEKEREKERKKERERERGRAREIERGRERERDRENPPSFANSSAHQFLFCPLMSTILN